jgi:outer membrane protein assembly factor BamB
MSQNTEQPSNWWMYHGNWGHTGFVQSGSNISTANVAKLKAVPEDGIQLHGPILSVPAIVDGYIYVGVANSQLAKNSNGGSFYKINIDTARIEKTFTWNISLDERDAHGFTGMGCTPSVANGLVHFSAFNGKFYCLDADTLELKWVTDLRNADLNQNQPVTNDSGTDGNPPAAGWSSPVSVGNRVYVGFGEGENPYAFGFIYCMDAQTGKVIWIYCTNEFEEGTPNQPNVLPPSTVKSPLSAPFSTAARDPEIRGCSVWSSIAYEPDLDRLYCAMGNPLPDSALPSKGLSNGLLVLDAGTGEFKGFFQAVPESSYRPSDIDVDVGASPTIFTFDNRKVVSFGGKNGGYFILDVETLELLAWRQLLPYFNDGSQIETVDPHSPDPNDFDARPSNATSNATNGENLYGTYSTAAFHPGLKRIFIGIGGDNYHVTALGIDYETTPFMRALDWNPQVTPINEAIKDAWPMDGSNPKKYSKVQMQTKFFTTVGMYTSPAESGLSHPAVVNDVVFFSTTKVSLYAFNANDGTLLWYDDLGGQTEGYKGGYGYCMGPAVWGNYVVAGALINGRDGGVLKIYRLQDQE